jgi:hypothetical protein
MNVTKKSLALKTVAPKIIGVDIKNENLAGWRHVEGYSIRQTPQHRSRSPKLRLRNGSKRQKNK